MRASPHHCAMKAISHMSQRYSPELQKKALARREQTQQDFDNFTSQLKELSRSEKPSTSLYGWVDTSAWLQCSFTDFQQSGSRRKKRTRSVQRRSSKLGGTSVMLTRQNLEEGRPRLERARSKLELLNDTSPSSACVL
jgi:hypothetical protein